MNLETPKAPFGRLRAIRRDIREIDCLGCNEPETTATICVPRQECVAKSAGCGYISKARVKEKEP